MQIEKDLIMQPVNNPFTKAKLTIVWTSKMITSVTSAALKINLFYF